MGDGRNSIAEWLQLEASRCPINGITRLEVGLVTSICDTIRERKIDVLGLPHDVQAGIMMLRMDSEMVTLGTLMKVANALDMELSAKLARKPGGE